MPRNRSIWVVFTGIFLYFIAFSVFRINDTDEGYILTASMRILAGELPYKDFFIHTPPVTFYAIAGVFKIFGQSLIVARVFTAVIGLLIAMLLYLTSLKIIPHFRYALIPSLIFMFWGTGQVNYPSFAWFGLLFALFSAYLFVLFLDHKKALFLIAAGIFSGVSFISKQNLGLCVFAVIALFVIINGFFTRRGIKNLFLLIPSFITPIAIAAYLFYLHGALPEFIKHVIFIAAQSGISRMEIFPYPSVRFPQVMIWGSYLAFFYFATKRASNKKDIFPFNFLMGSLLFFVVISVIVERVPPNVDYFLDHVKTGAIRGFYNLLVLSCIISLVTAVKKLIIKNKKDVEQNLKLSFLATFALLYIWAGLFISRDMLHHIFSLPPTYILAGYIFWQIKVYAQNKDNWFQKYAVTFPLMYFLMIGLAVNLNNEVFRDAEGPIYRMKFPIKVERAKYVLADRESANDITGIVRYIDKSTATNEKIFYPYWPDGEVYFLANRLPASFYHFIHEDTVKQDNQTVIINDIDKNKTRIIFTPKWRYDDTLSLSISTNNNNTYEVEKYICDNYKFKKAFGKLVILERIGQVSTNK